MELRRTLINPRLIENASLLPEDSAIRQEALIIMDTFESVTNGMHNPEAWEALDNLPRDSLFRDWDLLIRAIRDFYQGDLPSMVSHLEKIDPSSPPALIAGTLKESAASPRKRGPSTDPLANLVMEENLVLLSGAQQLTESLENGLFDLFADTALLLIEELKECPKD
jgi:hypothetical protein